MKFTKPEARYLARSARDSLRWARRYEKSIKTNMSSVSLLDSRIIAANAAVVDTRRRDANARMELARKLEMS